MTKTLTAAPAEEAELESDEESPDEAMDDVVEPKSEPSRYSSGAESSFVLSQLCKFQEL